jgi:hypothetical protein
MNFFGSSWEFMALEIGVSLLEVFPDAMASSVASGG